MQFNTAVLLLNVETIQDVSTGERVRNLISHKRILGYKTLPTINMVWNGTINNMLISLSVLIRERMYQNQKYVYIEGKLYIVLNTGKGSQSGTLYLNMQEIEDNHLKELIENALG